MKVDMEQSSEFNKAVAEILNEMWPFFQHHSNEEVINQRPPSFSEIAKTTIIKAYEFEVSITNHHGLSRMTNFLIVTNIPNVRRLTLNACCLPEWVNGKIPEAVKEN